MTSAKMSSAYGRRASRCSWGVVGVVHIVKRTKTGGVVVV